MALVLLYQKKAAEVPPWPGPRLDRWCPAQGDNQSGYRSWLATSHGSAEIYLMAVEPTVHRRGIGRTLVAALEDDLLADGVELLQVKVLGPSQPDASYEQTRQFYDHIGFQARGGDSRPMARQPLPDHGEDSPASVRDAGKGSPRL